MMKATLELVLFLLSGIAISAGTVVAGLLGLGAIVGGGWWWWLGRRGRRPRP